MHSIILSCFYFFKKYTVSGNTKSWPQLKVKQAALCWTYIGHIAPLLTIRPRYSGESLTHEHTWSHRGRCPVYIHNLLHSYSKNKHKYGTNSYTYMLHVDLRHMNYLQHVPEQIWTQHCLEFILTLTCFPGWLILIRPILVSYNAFAFNPLQLSCLTNKCTYGCILEHIPYPCNNSCEISLRITLSHLIFT